MNSCIWCCADTPNESAICSDECKRKLHEAGYKCDRCSGTGERWTADPADDPYDCGKCKGTGVDLQAFYS